jgi:hypothetical protein
MGPVDDLRKLPRRPMPENHTRFLSQAGLCWHFTLVSGDGTVGRNKCWDAGDA